MTCTSGDDMVILDQLNEVAEEARQSEVQIQLLKAKFQDIQKKTNITEFDSLELQEHNELLRQELLKHEDLTRRLQILTSGRELCIGSDKVKTQKTCITHNIPCASGCYKPKHSRCNEHKPQEIRNNSSCPAPCGRGGKQIDRYCPAVCPIFEDEIRILVPRASHTNNGNPRLIVFKNKPKENKMS